MRALWPVVHRCGHRVEWDLSRKHPCDRADFARWLALRDCTPCWWAKRRKHHPRSQVRPSSQEQSEWIEGWESATGMPRLAGSDKAVAWARKIRHRLLTAALPPSVRARGATDEAVLGLTGHARTLTAAAWWIDHRRIEPRHLAIVLDQAVAERASSPRERR